MLAFLDGKLQRGDFFIQKWLMRSKLGQKCEICPLKPLFDLKSHRQSPIILRAFLGLFWQAYNCNNFFLIHFSQTHLYLHLMRVNTCMKIEQLSEILDKQVVKSGAVNNVERMSKTVRKVLTEDAKQMSQGKEAYEEARQRDFERKCSEDMKNPRKMTFTEMVNRYL